MTKTFCDAADGNEYGMANPLWDPDFAGFWADSQVTGPDTGGGPVQQPNDEPLPDSQLYEYQAYSDNRLGMAHQSCPGRPLQLCPGIIPTQSSDEQLTRYVADRRLVHSYH